MNNAALEMFRLMTGAEMNWQWLGRWESQRMFGITRRRVEDYAARFGGEAREM